MAYEIVIRNLNTTEFNINNGTTLKKGVYEVVIEDVEKIGLRNINTSKFIVDPSTYEYWKKWPDVTFDDFNALYSYLRANIEVPGTSPAAEAEATQMDLVLDKLDTIIANQEAQMAKQDIMITHLSSIDANLKPS